MKNSIHFSIIADVIHGSDADLIGTDKRITRLILVSIEPADIDREKRF